MSPDYPCIQASAKPAVLKLPSWVFESLYDHKNELPAMIFITLS